MKSKTC